MRCLRHMVLALSSLVATLGLGGCTDDGDQAVDVTVIGDRAPRLADAALGPLAVPDQVLVQASAQGLVRFDARGQIEPGLAERWNVSDDGLSYVFRLQSGKWPNGRSINAKDVARLLKRQLASGNRNALRDTLGAVEDVVAMTDRVIEIRLASPRPNLLQLLAQPEFGIVRAGQGSGPFQPDANQDAEGAMALTYVHRIIDGPDRRDHVHLRVAKAPAAVASFASGKTDLVLGGTVDTLPLARRAKLPRGALRFDPVVGLFGLVPGRKDGPAADPEVRRLLSQAIDRSALIEALGVPGLRGRTTILQAGLDGLGEPTPRAWEAFPAEERRAQALSSARRQFGSVGGGTITVALPDGEGATILFDRLVADWGPLGMTVERVAANRRADLVLVDAVAPSTSPAWFVRRFRCDMVALCLGAADELMESARQTTVGAQRAAFIAEAARLLDDRTMFIALAAPIRWSLVADRLPGYSENIVARHPLTALREKLSRESR
jgi:oligopeptide transport system substrate-binding protein